MNITAILLLTVSAFIHVIWNIICKRKSPTQPFFFMSSLTSTIILSPFLIFNLPQVIALPSSLWLLIFISGIFMALYYVSLAAAYRTSDMSIVYPLTRSIPVLLVAIVTALLGQGKPIGHVAIAGIIFLKEPAHLPRITGALIILTGLTIIALT